MPRKNAIKATIKLRNKGTKIAFNERNKSPLEPKCIELIIQPLNVVMDPQKANPNINLYLLETGNALTNPNKKQPTIFTIQI